MLLANDAIWYVAFTFVVAWLALGAMNVCFFATQSTHRFTWLRATILILSGPIPFLISRD